MALAVITGASRGIGRAIAEQLYREGYRLLLNCRTQFDCLDALAASLNGGEARRCLAVHGPIDAACLRALSAEGWLDAGEPLVLVNNAGISRRGLLQDMGEDDWEALVNANLKTMFLATQAVLPHMLSQKRGRILNISSVWGEVGASCEVLYSMTKGGMAAYTKALARELAPSGISVNALACGAVDTEMNAELDAQDRELLLQELPMGRMATAEETARFAAQLLSAPAYLSGQVIRFDGAWT